MGHEKFTEQEVVARVRTALATGFTGQIILHCSEGDVRRMDRNEVLRPVVDSGQSEMFAGQRLRSSGKSSTV